jgi:hypothetical protein
MGGLCNMSSVNQNNEIIVNTYVRRDLIKRRKSMQDGYYDTFNRNNNLLKYIQLTEYAVLFTNFKFQNDNTTDCVDQKQNIFLENLDRFDYVGFLNTKIINHHLLKSFKQSETVQIFLDFLTKLYDIIGKGLISYASMNNKKGGEKMKDKSIKKYFLLAVGILFCHTDDGTKLDIFYHTFSNESNELVLNLHLKQFLFVQCLIASFGGMWCIHDVAKIYPKAVPNVKEEDYLKALELYEVSDIVEITDKYAINLFNETSGKLTYEEFMERITNQGHDWIFSGAGIRNTLENKEEYI